MLQWVLHVQNYKLTLDKNKCVGCQICSLACPKEAVTIQKQPRNKGQKARKAKIDVDLSKCNFCGICDVLCPYGAIRLTTNDEHKLRILEKESFPTLIRNIEVANSKYTVRTETPEDPCPLGLITLTRTKPEETTKKRPKTQVNVSVEKDRCPCCTICEHTLPKGTVTVHRFLQGKIQINPKKCPPACTDCLDVCPLTGALYYSGEDKKVHADERFCVYCGACKIVCPVEDALELKRTKIFHTPVSSGAWNKALERIASTIEMSKELKAKGSQKKVEVVQKLLAPQRENE
jgi:4Fe-4S ferredoxin